MPTVITKKIGATNSPTTMDYSSLQAWEDAMPANLVTGDTQQIGECYDQGEITATTPLLISGHTTDATRNIILRCATGASFADKGDVRTTALAYDGTTGQGVAVRSTGNYAVCIHVQDPNVTIRGLQISSQSVNSAVVWCEDNNANFVLDSCIVVATAAISGDVVSVYSDNGIIKNNLIIAAVSCSASLILTYRTDMGVYGNTIYSAGSTGNLFNQSNYHNVVIKNNAAFGQNAFKTGSGTTTGSSNNATDKATAVGTSNQTSLTTASQFVSVGSDFRAVDTGSLDTNGVYDGTNSPLDISGTAHNATTPTIGCWEVVGGGASLPALDQCSLTGGLSTLTGGLA